MCKIVSQRQKGFSGPQLWHKLSRFFTLAGLSAIKNCSYFTSNNTSSAFLVTQIFAKRSSSFHTIVMGSCALRLRNAGKNSSICKTTMLRDKLQENDIIITWP